MRKWMIKLLKYIVFCVVIVATTPIHAEGEFSYEKNTFINYWSCLGVYPGTSLELGEWVWLFSMKMPPVIAKVVHTIPAAEAKMRFDTLGFDKVYKDKPLWGKIRCVHSFRGDIPATLAQVAPDAKESDALGFAIRGLPAGALVAGGKGEVVTMGLKDNPYVGLVSHLVTGACYAPDSLVRVIMFPISKGRAIVQLDIGKGKKLNREKRKQKIDEEIKYAEWLYSKSTWPEQKKRVLQELESKKFFESVEICRFFIEGKRVLKADNISRRVDVEERVDTRIDLDNESWATTTDSAIGFVSLNPE